MCHIKSTCRFYFDVFTTFILKHNSSSSQDGGIGRYALLPCTTKRRITTNLKTKSNKNHKKIELYGSPTTKELQKKHSSRVVGGAETGSRCGEDEQQGSGWWTCWVRWRLMDWAVPPSQNLRHGDHMEGYQQGVGGMGKSYRE